MCPSHLVVTSSNHLTTPHSTFFFSVPHIPRHSYMLSLLSPSHPEIPHTSLIKLMSTAHILNCCATFHVHISDAYDRSWQVNTVFYSFLHIHAYTFSSLQSTYLCASVTSSIPSSHNFILLFVVLSVLTTVETQYSNWIRSKWLFE